METLNREDLQENIAIIKINRSYKNGLSALELYDITRGCWKRSINSVKDADYALAVVFGEVKEVYYIDRWVQAKDLNRETIPYNARFEDGRIGFIGEVAPEEIRDKYIGKSVANLFKKGDANPVRLFLKDK